MIVSVHAQNNDIWTRTSSSKEIEPYTTGYVNSAGKVVIPANKYVYCFTEKFDKIAFVLYKKPGDLHNKYYAIDRNENILFQVASWDNAPDNVIDGLFRIIVNDKMGFADMNGNIIIQPVYVSVLPFSENYAAFCIGGINKSDGEYNWIEGGKWGFLDKYGNIKIIAQFDRVFGSFKNGKAIVEKNGVTYRVDKNGTLTKY